MPRDLPTAPTDRDAAEFVSMVRAMLGAGGMTPDRETDMREAVKCQLDTWFLRGRSAQALLSVERSGS